MKDTYNSVAIQPTCEICGEEVDDTLEVIYVSSSLADVICKICSLLGPFRGLATGQHHMRAMNQKLKEMKQKKLEDEEEETK